jgi:transposase
MRILAIDLGKFKSVACDYDTDTAQHTFTTVRTAPRILHDLFVERSPDRVVIEIGSAAGWIRDLCEAMGLEVQIANPNHEAWRWKNVKRKTDKDDALKLAQLSVMNQLPTISLPGTAVRQWRSLIGYRWTLVRRRTAIKNSIRSILDRQGLPMPSGKSGWTIKTRASLHAEAQPLHDAADEELWRGQLHSELQSLMEHEALIKQLETKLEAIARRDERVQLLRTIPGVGPRLAEVVVATIDDPRRFKNAKQVGAYAGLAPRQYESGAMRRSGRITGRGNALLRTLLVEVSWLTRRYNPQLSAIFDQVCRGSRTRSKIAVVATARRLLIICWAMLRDGRPWNPRHPLPPPEASPTSASRCAVLNA